MFRKLHLTALVLIGTAVLPFVCAQRAAAISILVDGTTYELFAVNQKPSEHLDDFELFVNSGKMPWWGDINMASLFASQAGSALGSGSSSELGPLFAYSLSGTSLSGIVQSLTDPDSQDNPSVLTTDAVVYAIAADPSTFPPAPVPMPLPVFGAVSAYAWSRQLRRRLSTCQNDGSRPG